MLFFFRKKMVCGDSLRSLRGPAIIAANHPNSMMDAIAIGCSCRQPVHFTIRSDMFNNKLFNFLLKRLNGIPIYRVSEEKGRMRDNFSTIAYCKSVLQQNGIIIIFAEGVTLHDWELKPVKSGPSKIILHALTDARLKETLQVLPAGITYSSYSHSSKTIIIQAGNIIYPGRITAATAGKWKLSFNDMLQKSLQPLIPEMTSGNAANIALWESMLTQAPRYIDCSKNVRLLHSAGKKISQPGFHSPVTPMPTRRYWSDGRAGLIKDIITAVILFIPALAGLVLNGAFYFPLRNRTRAKTKNTIFYDSLLFGLLTILYPLYILLLSLVLYFTVHIPVWIWIIAIPVTALCTARWWVLLQKISRYSIMKKEEIVFLKGFFS